jgi:ectoine hydroxylase-related dioxygenase (phytanoyl-CoA dioxygenase family)
VRFRELVTRGHGRIDVRLGFEQPPFDDARLREASEVVDLIDQALGGERTWLTGGLLLALPGAAQQTTHRDGGQLFRETGIPLPAHCLHVFVPLGETDCTVAPTMFFLGSHLRDKAEGLPTAGVVPFGSAIVFDYRVLHYGSANNSPYDRWIAYLTYARPWFRDVANYPLASLIPD